MAKTRECEIHLMIDAQGDYSAVAGDGSDLAERYTSEIGSVDDSNGYRIYRLLLNVPIPDQVEVQGTVTPEGGSVSLTVKTDK